jgi:NAD(P)-dependent dehydrogenase (short-subunit alcohol dehydrogenase family)
MKGVVFITGASSGMGRSAAELFIENGYTVYGGARRLDKMQDIKGLIPIKMDITKTEDIEAAVSLIEKEQGRIDILFNNAGYGFFGAIENVSQEDYKRQFDVCLFGLAEICKKVIPIMRKNGGGRIINNSSMGGRTYMPYGGWYISVKYALEGLSDCMRFELKPFNIKVVLIEPGNVESEWTGIMLESLERTTKNTAYEDSAKGMIKLTKNLKHFTPSETIAKTVYKAATLKNPKTRYLTGKNTYSVFLRKILGDKLYDKLFEFLIKN